MGGMPHLCAVAWDIDGTLVDSEPLHHRALVAASLEFGVDLRDLPDMAFRGVHMGDVWKRLAHCLPPLLEEEVWISAINRHYVRARHTLVAIPGAVETVRALHELGIRQVCVSNSCRAVVDANLDALGIGRWIQFSISLDDVTEGKPSPVPYCMAAQRLGRAPAQIIAVEDSSTGICSAKAAGLHAVFLRTGDNGGQAQQEASLPDVTIDNLLLVRGLFETKGALCPQA
ncbi:HAD family hydrolase [Rhizobium sp. AC44/96]|uniref:HAD family hydrolase n=1 Tax=unclassified Rhizobium TaxID=2613769 RepID=UPI00080FB316|nr:MULTISPECIES: HAD family phosphatase [unclassified Rhizobium]MDM9622886.1 HAD family phosphatase [Rhizobium sp. S96]OCJ13218.1 HAD family hydrolase [Rhizobium sp. AC44/96]